MATYRVLGNNILPENINYDAQFWNDQTTQHLILNESSELNYISGETVGPSGLHVINQVKPKDNKNNVGDR